MRRVRFLLRPGWVILALVVAAFAYLCFTVLAPWQLGKNSRTAHRNQLISDSVRADPAPLDRIVAPGAAEAAAGDEWRRVVLTGHYLPDSTLLVRLRPVEGKPAFEVLSAFRVADGRTVLIDRGYVRPIGGTDSTPPPVSDTAAPAGAATVQTRLRRSEGVIPGKDFVTQHGYRQVYSIDSSQASRLLGTALVGGYFQLEPGQPGAFTPVALPQLDAGPYLSYGLQWLAFGIMAPLGLAYFIRAELRERRRTGPATSPATQDIREPRRTRPATSPATHDKHEPRPTEPPTTATQDKREPRAAAATPQDRLADRYGRR